MATTRIMPLHAGKGRTVGKAISDIIDYVKNPEKTDHGRLITSYQCDSRVADAQFLLDKQTYAARTGRMRGADDVIAYHLRQSFVPGEITPEEANRLGVELARRFTKGKHAFIVCTHIDKAHVHNHIIWNSTTLECDRKFRNFWGSTRAVHRLSDTICIENGYSIVEALKRRGQSYNKWLGDAAKPSHKEQLRQAIDRALAQKPASLEELLRLLKQDGFTVHRRGKTISIDAVVFQMTDALTRKQMDKALAVLADLLRLQQAPIMILAVLGKHFRQIYTARVALESGQNSRWLMQLWGMRSAYPADKLMEGARRHGLDWCCRAMRRCAETDLAMKSVAGADAKDLLVSLILELSAGGTSC